MRLVSATSRTTPQGLTPPPADATPALLIGGWGDVLAGIGNLRAARPGQTSQVVYFGRDHAVAEFLAQQPCVEQVIHEVAHDHADYVRAAINPQQVAARLGAENLSPPFQRNSSQEVQHWHGAVLPQDAREWAKLALQGLPAGQRYLIFPRSTRNASWAGHWPYWERLMRWLLEHTSHQFVLCGEGWRPEIQHDHLLNLVNQTPTLAEVFAVAECCDGVLTTSSALSLWTAIQRLPAAVYCNDQDQRDTYWHRWISTKPNLVVENHATFEHGLMVAKQLFQRTQPREQRVLPKVQHRKTLEIVHDDKIRLCVPPGIGDISWVYSAGLHCLAEKTGREVLLYLADDRREDLPAEHNAVATRSEPFIDLLPGVKFGGYVPERSGWEVVNQSLPMVWPVHMGYGPIRDTLNKITNVSANVHLELGNGLESIFPMQHWEKDEPLLPTEYHYDLAIPEEEHFEAQRLLADLEPGVCAIYVSNRDKEKFPDWKLWTAEEWVRMMELSGAKSFVILGASWDRDKTDDVVALAEQRWPVLRLVGQPLARVFAVMQRCQAGCYFPSGMGILANVLRQPAAMLLPYHLRKLVKFADPEDVAAGRYRAFPAKKAASAPKVEDVAAFLRPHLVRS